MKKFYISLLMTFLLTVPAVAQYGFFPDFFGDLTYRDLSNPTNSVLIGTTMNQIGASDFGPDNQYYAISGSDDGLYVIDTEDGSATFIATVTPPGSAFWTGMALDPTEGTMYICSTDGTTSSYYTIDLTDGSTTLVGTNTESDGVVGIAFDYEGQMYAIYLVRDFYMIDKTDASATFVGDLFQACSGLPHHGLDYEPLTQTMYMVSYNVFTFDNELWTIDLETAENTLVGSVGLWTGSVAVEPLEILIAGFSADVYEVCAGESVAFMDESTGGPETWSWTFEGGTPATSTEQNPVIMYENNGTFDVDLEVTAGPSVSSILAMDIITVYEVPAPEIYGPALVCEGDVFEYYTAAVTGSTHEWEVEGGDIIDGAGTSLITVEWGEPGTGSVTVTEDNGFCTATAGPYEVVIEECTFVGEQHHRGLALHPNPAKETITVKHAGLKEGALMIFDAAGRMRASRVIAARDTAEEITIDIRSLSPCIYIVRFRAADGTHTNARFIKTE